ncbi:hypothetical protein HALLA_21100 (plasmid) [Halostagnicola larsenii XH-48]|uniref:Uncharacterized protein n=1 Tax=Halostagnicola larsenii XH-48 TaxID=797299 RepID=W0JYY0_9EURY|nr:hypothetical protein HALLA_21100 [Halostagnicola larsenii XH-48]
MISLTTTMASLIGIRQPASGGYGSGPAIGLEPNGRGWIGMLPVSIASGGTSIRAA